MFTLLQLVEGVTEGTWEVHGVLQYVAMLYVVYIVTREFTEQTSRVA
jgi:hypothetical protein